MAQITKIDNNAKLEEVRKRAHAAFQKENFEQTLQIIAQANTSKDDHELIHLMGRAAFNLGDHSLAKECFEKVLKISPTSENVIRELFDVYNNLKEYRKLLHCANLLFGMQTDHTSHILHILRLYRRLGLYGRALDLFETLDENGYYGEPFLQEKAALYLEITEHQKLEELLLSNSLGNELEKRIKREIRLGPARDIGWNLKSLYYRQYGKILLGSYSDDGASADIYDDFYFDEDHFYETCLRFVDLVNGSRISYTSIRSANPSETTIARILGKILNIPFQAAASRSTNGLHLIVHAGEFESFPHENSYHVHHLCFGFSFAETPENILPEYVGVVLTGSPPEFFFDHRSQNSEKLAEEIYHSMRSKEHISTLGKKGITYFSILPEFALSQSNVIRLPFGADANTEIDKLFLQVEKGLRKDGPLYLYSLLDSLKGRVLNSNQVKTLLSFHKEWDFIPCSLPGFCAFHDLDQTFHFYQQEWNLASVSPELITALAQIPHKNVGELLLPLLDRDTAHHEFFISSGAWVLLQFNPEFSNWMEQILDHPTFLVSGFEHISLVESWDSNWIKKLTKLLPRLEPEHCDTLLDQLKTKSVRLTKKDLIELSNSLKEPTLTFLHHLSERQIEFPQHFHKWLKDCRKSPVFAEVLNLFLLPDIFSNAWDQQKTNPQELQFAFANLTHPGYRGIAAEMIELYPKVSAQVKTEILSYFFLNNLNIEFCFSEIAKNHPLKYSLRAPIIKFLENNGKVNEDQDLLYLMEGDELERFRCARYFLKNSDMEFYPYLIHKMKTQGLLLGSEGLITLFEIRSDKALKILVDYALAVDGCSPRQIYDFLNWICENPYALDEWMLLLGSLELNEQKDALQQWMQKYMESIPPMLLIYVRFFPDDFLPEIINTYWNTHSDLSEKVKIIEFLDPTLLKSFHERIHHNHFQFQVLETKCVPQQN